MTIIHARLNGRPFSIELADMSAPETIRLLLGKIPFVGEAIHATWSGPVILCHLHGVRELPIENPVTFLAAGNVIYHPSHFEIGIAYDTSQFREPIGSVYVSRVGQVAARGLDEIITIGRHLQRTGAQQLQFEGAE